MYHYCIGPLPNPVQVPLDSFTLLRRIHYKARSDETWGEHEIDYILFSQRDVDILHNPNEVMDFRYVSQQELRELLEEGKEGRVKITPWFGMICESLLFKWWDGLSNLAPFIDTSTIQRLN